MSRRNIFENPPVAPIAAPGPFPVPLPVVMLNQPPPGIDPFMAILYSQFIAGNVWLEGFWFTAKWEPLGSGQSGAPFQTAIDAGIDFIVQQMQVSTWKTDDTFVPTPQLDLEVQETNGRASWADGPMSIGNWCGNTNHTMPYWFPTPRYVRGSNTINWKLTNNDAVAYNVKLAIGGMRVTYVKTSREELFKVPY